MQVTARTDYAVRALLVLATSPEGLVTRDQLAEAQDIPPRYLESILGQLRQAGLVHGQRGAAGGYRLGAAADRITVGDVSRAVDGPLALVQGRRPEEMEYTEPCVAVGELWVGVRAAIRSVFDAVTLADLATGTLPAAVRDLTDDPAAWLPR